MIGIIMTHYLPMHIMLKVNPFCTDFVTSWSGNESKPTCPDRFRDLAWFPPMACNDGKM